MSMRLDIIGSWIEVGNIFDIIGVKCCKIFGEGDYSEYMLKLVIDNKIG